MFVGLDRSVTAALADEFRLRDAVFGARDLVQQLPATGRYPATQNPAPILRTPHHMHTQRAHPARCATKPVPGHATNFTKRDRQTHDHTLFTRPDSPDGSKPPVPSDG